MTRKSSLKTARTVAIEARLSSPLGGDHQRDESSGPRASGGGSNCALRLRECRPGRLKSKNERILTSINQAVVVLGEGLGSVSGLDEDDGCGAFGAAVGVVVDLAFADGSDGRREEFLRARV